MNSRLEILKILVTQFPITVIAFPEISGLAMNDLCVQPVFVSEVLFLWSNLSRHLIWQIKMWIRAWQSQIPLSNRVLPSNRVFSRPNIHAGTFTFTIGFWLFPGVTFHSYYGYWCLLIFMDYWYFNEFDHWYSSYWYLTDIYWFVYWCLLIFWFHWSFTDIDIINTALDNRWILPLEYNFRKT